MGHVELDFKISGTADMAATGAGPMNGYCAMLSCNPQKQTFLDCVAFVCRPSYSRLWLFSADLQELGMLFQNVRFRLGYL